MWRGAGRLQRSNGVLSPHLTSQDTSHVLFFPNLPVPDGSHHQWGGSWVGTPLSAAFHFPRAPLPPSLQLDPEPRPHAAWATLEADAPQLLPNTLVGSC